MLQIKSHRDIIVWQKAMELVIAIYKLTENFPKTEIYGLISQMRRCSVSIPSNIAEGKSRGTRKDYRYFLILAYGSGAELETQIEISKKLFNLNLDYDKIDKLLEEIMKILNKLISALNLEPKT